MVYTSVGILRVFYSRTFRKDSWVLVYNWLEHLECLARKKALVTRTLAAALHWVSRLLNQSRSLVIIVLIHYKRCTASKRATAAHTHAPYKCAISTDTKYARNFVSTLYQVVPMLDTQHRASPAWCVLRAYNSADRDRSIAQARELRGER